MMRPCCSKSEIQSQIQDSSRTTAAKLVIIYLLGELCEAPSIKHYLCLACMDIGILCIIDYFTLSWCRVPA